MLTHPNFSPIALEIGALQVRWYGLMYIIAFITFFYLGRYRIRQQQGPFTEKIFEDFLFYGMLGVVIGGRLGFIFFYQLDYYLANPIKLFYVWEGGMSFHGGLLGVIVAMTWVAKSRLKVPFLVVADFIAPLVPLGLFAGRIGNFINQELVGRPTDVAWGMIFPILDDPTPRHPSQLYEAFGEGLLLFFLLWFFSSKPRPVGQVAGVFLLGYGVARFSVEFTREPDAFLGFILPSITMGQILSMPMILLGLFLLFRRSTITSHSRS